MRLFVAAWPPPEVVAAVSGLAGLGAPADGVRWVAPDKWHVTLRFLGSVDETAVPDLQARLAGMAWPAAVEAVVGPSTACLGRSVLVVPVEGLDALAAAVVEATAGIGGPAERRPFRGHLTLARAGDRRLGGQALRRRAGVPVPRPGPGSPGSPGSPGWPVAAVDLVRSVGGRYVTVSRHPRTNARSKLRSRE